MTLSLIRNDTWAQGSKLTSAQADDLNINTGKETVRMANLIPPHGGKGLTICLLEGAEREAELKKDRKSVV